MSKNDTASADKPEETAPPPVSMKGDNWIAFGLFFLFIVLCACVYLLAQRAALPGAPGAPVGLWT